MTNKEFKEFKETLQGAIDDYHPYLIEDAIDELERKFECECDFGETLRRSEIQSIVDEYDLCNQFQIEGFLRMYENCCYGTDEPLTEKQEEIIQEMVCSVLDYRDYYTEFSILIENVSGGKCHVYEFLE